LNALVWLLSVVVIVWLALMLVDLTPTGASPRSAIAKQVVKALVVLAALLLTLWRFGAFGHA
jgi:hypothetical protein